MNKYKKRSTKTKVRVYAVLRLVVNNLGEDLDGESIISSCIFKDIP